MLTVVLYEREGRETRNIFNLKFSSHFRGLAVSGNTIGTITTLMRLVWREGRNEGSGEGKRREGEGRGK